MNKEQIREAAKSFLNGLGSLQDEATFIDGVNFALDKIDSQQEKTVMPEIAEETLNKIAPFLARLVKPRFDKYETDEYVNNSSDCIRALEAFVKYRDSKISD